ncbi:MAG: DUF4252 domain-containing protein [Verrucomicrobiales bacterium]|nr:DUF4252 domain-containing protein [Verrucomicrobiales bacterium]
MKPILSLFALPILSAALISSPLLGDSASPGYVDLGTFTAPAGGGQFVEVDLKGSLLTMAAKIAAKEEPEVAEVLRGIEAVRVNVVGVTDGNRAELSDRIRSLRSGLATSGWERVVNVQQDAQDVGVFIKTKGPDSIAGVVVTVMDGKGEAVFVNVVGDIQPEKLAALGEHFGIDPLKKVGQATEKGKK